MMMMIVVVVDHDDHDLLQRHAAQCFSARHASPYAVSAELGSGAGSGEPSPSRPALARETS
jgi:hypothetical protein